MANEALTPILSLELGRQAGEIEFDRVAENFFVKPKAQDYVPFTHEN